MDRPTRQNRTERLKKPLNITVTALFLLLIFGFGIAFWIVPDKDYSPEENRYLQSFPTLSVDGWLEGKVSGRLIEYYSDQFPLRQGWVELHALSELASGRGESSGVLLGEDGQLAVRRFDMYRAVTAQAAAGGNRLKNTDYYDEAHVKAGLDALVALDGKLTAEGIPLTVLLAPRTLDVTAGDFAYPSVLSDQLDTTIEATLSAGDVDSVEMLSTFRRMHDAGEYVYYRTDHHWTTKGAYTAYAAVLSSWDMEAEILPTSAFTVRSVPGFFGTTHSRAGIPGISADTLEIWNAADGSDSRFIVRDGRGETVIQSGFISEKYLSEKDKYGAFLDGTHSLLTITQGDTVTPGEAAPEGARPRLLLARDSFANSMVPFLARHYDIVMVNLSGGMTDLSALAAEYDCDRVLVVCNRENLVTSDCFTRIQ